MNSKSNNNIYEICKQIEDEREKLFELQAKKIANAYRQVEQIKVQKAKSPKRKRQQFQKLKPQSAYAIKIKETLKQINANKSKQMQNVNRLVGQRMSLPQTKIDNQIQKLLTVGISKMDSSIDSYKRRTRINCLQVMVQFAKEQERKENFFIIKFRKFKVFRAWKDETLFSKFQKKKEDSRQTIKEEQLASEFKAFNRLKKCFYGWMSYAKKEIKRKIYQKQLIKKQLQVKKEEEQKGISKTVQTNQELQSKVRNFIDGLKQKVEKKDRLRTIKQKTEESDLHLKMSMEQKQRQNSSLDQQFYQQSHNIVQQLYQQTHNNQNVQDEQYDDSSQVVIHPPSASNERSSKQMTNQQLQQKRRELQIKHKSRKEALQKLKREKNQKKKQQELERQQLERQVEAEEKRLKQQKYKQYIKNKQQQEEWDKRERQLELRAQKFNIIRLKKYYGWIPLTSVKKQKIKNATCLYQTLLLIIYRLNSNKFIRNLQEVSNDIVESQLQRMDKKYKLKLITKGLSALYHNRQQQRQLKGDLFIRHQVNQLKIYFSSWKRALSLLREQNFDWERPRTKRAQQFQRLQLLHKGLTVFKINKQQEQRSRTIAEQKNKIKNKIKSMLQQQEVNYEQFL